MVSTLVFPPPGCADAQRIVEPFEGFDVLSSTGGTFVNLLTSSVNLSKQPWIRGSGSQVITSSFDVLDWYTNDQQILDKSDVYVLSNGFGDNLIVTGSSSAYLGQRLSVKSNTTYTASFFAKRGTATELTYGVYDLTNEQNIVDPTSYYNETGSTYSRIEFTFTTGVDTAEIIFYPIWTIASGAPGSVNISAPQVEESNFASAYDATTDVSLAVLGIETVTKESYNITTLSTFVDATKDFDPIHIIGQSKAKWNVVSDYIFEGPILGYSAKTGNNTLEFRETLTRPYLVGDTVTVSSPNVNYRQNFTVTAFTANTLTINTTNAVPVNGAIISDPTPAVYPQSFEVLNLGTYKRGVTSITKPRENLYLSTVSPNDRAVEYYIDRDLLSSDSILVQGQVNVANTVRIPTQLPSSGKVELKNNFREVSPRRPTQRIETLTPSTGFVSNNYLASWKAGIFRLSDQYATGTSLFANPVFESGSIIPVDSNLTSFRLEPYSNQGVYVGPLARVTDTDNIRTFNTVRDFIFEDIFSTTQQLTQYPTFLYFNESQESTVDKIRFPKGSFVKITNIITGEFLVTEVLDTVVNGIKVNITSTLANQPTGNVTIQDASPFYYPKEKVVLDNVSIQLPITLVSNPRDNLYLSEQPALQKTRSTSFFIGRDLGEVTDRVLESNKSLELYETNGILTPDYSVKVTGENTSIKYNTVVWYTNDNNVLTYTVTPITNKVLYFADQPVLPFRVNQEVRLKNTDIGYNKVVTVLESSNRHITIAISDDYPGIGNLFIESMTTSVYEQKYVYTNIAPTNSRENLFYFNLLPSLRASKLPVEFISNNNDINTNTFGDYIRINEARSTIQSDFLNRDLITLKDIPLDNRISKLSTASTKLSVASGDVLKTLNINTFTSQSTVRPTTNPTTAAERFYYFTLAPGYRSNSSINYGVNIFSEGNIYQAQTLQKDSTKLNSVNTVFDINSITSTTPLFTDRSTLSADLIDRFKTVDYTAFEVDQVEFLQKGYIKVTSSEVAFNNEFLNKDYVKVVSGDEPLNVGKLRNVTPLLSDSIKFNTELLSKDVSKLTSITNLLDINLISKFKTVDYTSLDLTDRGTLRSAVKVVNIDNNLYNVEKVTSATILKQDQLFKSTDIISKFLTKDYISLELKDQGKVTASSVVRETTNVTRPGNLRAATVLKPGGNVSSIRDLSNLGTYNSQSTTVITNTFPVPPRENLLYTLLAPGYRYNKSIQQGLVFDNGYAQTQTFDYLSQFSLGGNLVDVYPSDLVAPTGAPTNAREMLRYSILAPGYKTNNAIQQGLIFSSNDIQSFDRVTLLERDAWKLVEDRANRTFSQLTTLEKSLLFLREIYPDAVGYKGYIEKTTFGVDQNEFFELKLETKGDIIRLRTTSYVDIASPKKEPIQFWN